MDDLPHYRATLIAVAVVEDSGRFLVGRRAPGATLAGLAEFPGGKIHAGESPATAAERECFEESGLAVQVGKPYPVVGHEYPQGRLEIHFFHCTLDASKPPAEPRAPFRWVPAAELTQLQFPEANRDVLRSLTAR
jgi:8-oxo-dGTP diphosphatase